MLTLYDKDYILYDLFLILYRALLVNKGVKMKNKLFVVAIASVLLGSSLASADLKPCSASASYLIANSHVTFPAKVELNDLLNDNVPFTITGTNNFGSVVNRPYAELSLTLANGEPFLFSPHFSISGTFNKGPISVSSTLLHVKDKDKDIVDTILTDFFDSIVKTKENPVTMKINLYNNNSSSKTLLDCVQGQFIAAND